jgi:hypothetical protein
MGRGTRTQQAASAAISNHELRRVLDRGELKRPAWVDATDPYAGALGRKQLSDIAARAFATRITTDDPDLAVRLDGVHYRARNIWRLKTLLDRVPLAQHGPERRIALMVCVVNDFPDLRQEPGLPRLCVVERERMSFHDEPWGPLEVLAHTDHDLDAMIAAMNVRAQELVAAGSKESFREPTSPWGNFDDDSTYTTREKVYTGLEHLERFGWQ